MVLVSFAVTVGALLGPASPAWACSCMSESVAQSVDRADVVLTGEITERRDPEGTGPLINSSRPVTYVVAVSVVHKGQAAATTHITSAADGASCGIEVKPGREYVLVAEREGATLRANLCGGTAPVTPALVAEVERAAGPAATPGAAPAPGIPGASGPVADDEGLLGHVSTAWLAAALVVVAAVLALLLVVATRRRR